MINWKNKGIARRTLLFISFLVFIHSINAQTDTTQKDLVEMDLSELMTLSIVSASKKSEKVFDSPLSVSVVTKEDIKSAGCTNIQEAFRLVPGVIVREETNGNFSIQIRGLENVPPMYNINTFGNSTTLVMIDNRPVYNYFLGGTMWQALPIDLNDIEKIEVIRGASSALYGPNAASGVINIITRKIEKKGYYAVGNTMYSNTGNKILNGSVGYKWNKLSLIGSANYQGRQRGQDTYYQGTTGQYVPLDSINYTTLGQPYNRSHYPVNKKLSSNSFGVNLFGDYVVDEKKNISLSGGYQKADYQFTTFENIATPLSRTQPESFYTNGLVKWNNLNSQLSLHEGHTIANDYGFKFSNIDAVVDYDINIKGLNIKPGINFRNAQYGNYPDSAVRFIQSTKTLRTLAGSLRLDYKLLNEKLRLISGLRLDKFNAPSKAYFSYQNVVSYKINNDHHFRAVYSRAYRAPFLVDLYTDRTFPPSYSGTVSTPFGNLPVYSSYTYKGNNQLKLLKSTLIELGYRGQLSSAIQIDLELFHNIVTDFEVPIVGATTAAPNPSFTQINTNTSIISTNIPTKSYQTGATLSLNIVEGNIQIKPFVTYQYTKLVHYSPYGNTADAPPNPMNSNPQTYNLNYDSSLTSQGTPTFYGGGFFDFKLSEQWHVNLNPYFYTTSTYYHNDYMQYQDGNRGVAHISGKLIVNAKVSYQPIKKLSIFVNARNLLNDRSVEFYKTDNIGISVYGGISFQY